MTRIQSEPVRVDPGWQTPQMDAASGLIPVGTSPGAQALADGALQDITSSPSPVDFSRIKPAQKHETLYSLYRDTASRADAGRTVAGLNREILAAPARKGLGRFFGRLFNTNGYQAAVAAETLTLKTAARNYILDLAARPVENAGVIKDMGAMFAQSRGEFMDGLKARLLAANPSLGGDYPELDLYVQALWEGLLEGTYEAVSQTVGKEIKDSIQGAVGRISRCDDRDTAHRIGVDLAEASARLETGIQLQDADLAREVLAQARADLRKRFRSIEKRDSYLEKIHADGPGAGAGREETDSALAGIDRESRNAARDPVLWDGHKVAVLDAAARTRTRIMDKRVAAVEDQFPGLDRAGAQSLAKELGERIVQAGRMAQDGQVPDAWAAGFRDQARRLEVRMLVAVRDPDLASGLTREGTDALAALKNSGLLSDDLLDRLALPHEMAGSERDFRPGDMDAERLNTVLAGLARGEADTVYSLLGDRHWDAAAVTLQTRLSDRDPEQIGQRHELHRLSRDLREKASACGVDRDGNGMALVDSLHRDLNRADMKTLDLLMYKTGFQQLVLEGRDTDSAALRDLRIMTGLDGLPEADIGYLADRFDGTADSERTGRRISSLIQGLEKRRPAMLTQVQAAERTTRPVGLNMAALTLSRMVEDARENMDVKLSRDQEQFIEETVSDAAAGTDIQGGMLPESVVLGLTRDLMSRVLVSDADAFREMAAEYREIQDLKQQLERLDETRSRQIGDCRRILKQHKTRHPGTAHGVGVNLKKPDGLRSSLIIRNIGLLSRMKALCEADHSDPEIARLGGELKSVPRTMLWDRSLGWKPSWTAADYGRVIESERQELKNWTVRSLNRSGTSTWSEAMNQLPVLHAPEEVHVTQRFLAEQSMRLYGEHPFSDWELAGDPPPLTIILDHDIQDACGAVIDIRQDALGEQIAGLMDEIETRTADLRKRSERQPGGSYVDDAVRMAACAHAMRHPEAVHRPVDADMLAAVRDEMEILGLRDLFDFQMAERLPAGARLGDLIQTWETEFGGKNTPKALAEMRARHDQWLSENPENAGAFLNTALDSITGRMAQDSQVDIAVGRGLSVSVKGELFGLDITARFKMMADNSVSIIRDDRQGQVHYGVLLKSGIGAEAGLNISALSDALGADLSIHGDMGGGLYIGFPNRSAAAAFASGMLSGEGDLSPLMAADEFSQIRTGRIGGKVEFEVVSPQIPVLSSVASALLSRPGTVEEKAKQQDPSVSTFRAQLQGRLEKQSFTGSGRDTQIRTGEFSFQASFSPRPVLKNAKVQEKLIAVGAEKLGAAGRSVDRHLSYAVNSSKTAEVDRSDFSRSTLSYAAPAGANPALALATLLRGDVPDSRTGRVMELVEMAGPGDTFVTTSRIKPGIARDLQRLQDNAGRLETEGKIEDARSLREYAEQLMDDPDSYELDDIRLVSVEAGQTETVNLNLLLFKFVTEGRHENTRVKDRVPMAD